MYSWCIMSTHDASWVLMMHHEYSWSWVLMMHHEYSWCLSLLHHVNTHDASWVLMMHLICHQMERHGSWEDFNQTNLDDVSVRVFANFEIFGSPLFVLGFLLFFMLFWNDPGAPMDHSVTTADQFGCNRGLQWPFCVEVTFQEIQNPGNRLLSVSCDGFRLNSGQSMQNRRPVISNHPFILKTHDI